MLKKISKITTFSTLTFVRRSLYAYWCWTPCTFKQCDSKEHRCVKDFSHKLHLYGRTPVCVRVCRFKSNVSLNPLPQKVHRYRLTSEWHFMCLFNSRCSEKLFEQIPHINLLPSSSVMHWIFTFSSSRMRPGPFSRARGFLMPCPPLTNSNWTSVGNPNCKQKKKQ